MTRDKEERRGGRGLLISAPMRACCNESDSKASYKSPYLYSGLKLKTRFSSFGNLVKAEKALARDALVSVAVELNFHADLEQIP